MNWYLYVGSMLLISGVFLVIYVLLTRKKVTESYSAKHRTSNKTLAGS